MACDPPWDLGSVILELYLLSFLEESVRGGGEGSAVTGWTEQEMVDRRRRREYEGTRGLQGKRVARGERIVACIAARACVVGRV